MFEFRTPSQLTAVQVFFRRRDDAITELTVAVGISGTIAQCPT